MTRFVPLRMHISAQFSEWLERNGLELAEIADDGSTATMTLVPIDDEELDDDGQD